MSYTLIFESIRIISESSISEKDKKDLISTIRTALHWTKEQKDLYEIALKEWDINHPRVPRILPDGRVIWKETTKSDPEILN